MGIAQQALQDFVSRRGLLYHDDAESGLHSESPYEGKDAHLASANEIILCPLRQVKRILVKFGSLKCTRTDMQEPPIDVVKLKTDVRPIEGVNGEVSGKSLSLDFYPIFFLMKIISDPEKR